MPTYTVTLKSTIRTEVEVEASSKKEAKEKALEDNMLYMGIDATKFEVDDFKAEKVED